MHGRRCAGEPRPAIKDRVGLGYETLSKINLGLPDQSRARSEESLALARQASDPFALALSLLFAADLHQRRGEPEQALEYAYAALELSSGGSHSIWATILRGWALARQGSHEEGIALLHRGLGALEATGAALGDSCVLPRGERYCGFASGKRAAEQRVAG